MKATKFIQNQYLWSGFKEKVLPFLTDKEYAGTPTMFTLPRYMSDSELQKETSSKPIPVELLASALQSFLKDADKSKWYIYHTQTGNGCVAFGVCWRDDEWDFDADAFDDGLGWDGGRVFVSFAVADSKSLKTGDLDSLTLEKALEVVKDAGYIVYEQM